MSEAEQNQQNQEGGQVVNNYITNVTKEPFISIDWEELRNIIAWIAGAAVLASLIFAPVSCSRNNNEQMAAAVKAGSNPIDAACAFSSQPPSNACLLRAAQMGKELK